MDPISALMGASSLIGLGMQAFGISSASSHAKEAANLQGNITRDESAVDAQRQQAMELSARRQQMEIIRNNQRARSQATNAAVNQGAQFGSGISGGIAQVDDQSSFNLQGVNQNLDIGRNIFGINQDISRQKIALGQVQGQMATDQGITSLGGALVKAGPLIGTLSGNFAGGFGGGSRGNYSGTPGASNTGGLY